MSSNLRPKEATLSLFRSGVIYTLNCPDTNIVTYVGKSFSIKDRKNSHFSASLKEKTKKAMWVRHLKSLGKRPIFNIIDDCDEFNWEQKERFYIKLYKACGANLLNITMGGECGSMGHKRSQESKDNISAKMKGLVRTKEHLENNANALKDKFKTDSDFYNRMTIINLKKISNLTQAQKELSYKRSKISRNVPKEERVKLANKIMIEINKGGKTRVEIAEMFDMSYGMLKLLLKKHCTI